jgi:molybdopterin-guanine dinucleotide biosynthesis protein
MLRWFFSAIVFSFFIAMVGMANSGNTLLSQASADDKERKLHPEIVKLEEHFARVDFDLKRKSHLLRKMRMEQYISRAKQADLRGWDIERDDLLERAENILSHHLTQYAANVSQGAETYKTSSI